MSALDPLDILGDVPAQERVELSGTFRLRKLAPGKVLFEQGDGADGCYFLLEGEIVVDLEIEGQGIERLATLAPGDLFGEVALLDGKPRSATCAAGPGGAKLAELDRRDFERLFEAGDAAARALMGVVLDRLVTRLRGATKRLLDEAG